MFVANEVIPVSVVESPKIQYIFAMVNPASITILSVKTYISEIIIAKFFLTCAELIHHLSKIDHISIACDGWTSATNFSCFGVTSH